MIELKGKYTTAKIMIDQVEPELISQLFNILNHEIFKDKSVRMMPDCHVGKGCSVGFTSYIDNNNPKIIPNIIGVDIGCGMLSVNIGDSLPLPIEDINAKIQEKIPMGFCVNNKPKVRINKQVYEKVCNKIKVDYNRVLLSLGSLGGGNHFIELGIDLNKNYWITVHTGSRNFGKCICDYHQETAQKYIHKIASVPLGEFKQKYSGIELGKKIKEFNDNKSKADKNLCYIEKEDALDYIEDMKLALEYASLNRVTIINEIINILNCSIYEKIESIHNYIDFNDFIVRKGAIRSYLNEKMIIPFNMRDGILICEGKSNPDWNYSAPHGAGRIMSRSEAKKNISLDDYKTSMEGIYTTCVNNTTIDESPMVYKDSKMIEDSIAETCTIINRIKPIINIKTGGD